MGFLTPPAKKPLLAADKIDKEYKRMRLKVFLGIYLGYAAYYLVRKNLSLAAPGMIEEGLIDKAGAGLAMSGIPIAYAVSKFIMGSISDRSDARKFMTVGLILSSLVMILAGILPYPAGVDGNYSITVGLMFVFMLFAGWLSGMGWPPCGRVLAHWFSTNERSFKMSVWNTAHNVGNGTLGLLIPAGIIIFTTLGITETWRAAFIIPATVALLLALFCWWAIRDTPESCGLPAIEEYRNDHSGAKAAKGEEEKIPFRRLFVDYILKNRMLWLIAFANVFVYLIRYGIADWSPTYLTEVFQWDKDSASIAYAVREYAGIPGTILGGWISTKFFNGRCAPVNVIFLIAVTIGILGYWQADVVAAATHIPITWIIYTSLAIIGGAIYAPVAMIGVQGLAIVPKNAAGTAAGFLGLFGYLLGDAVLSKIVLGNIAQSSLGWNATFWVFVVGALLAAVICAVSWGKEKRMMEERIAAANK
ncbi:MAG: MFS transporter [Alistipes sp.]|nr:MFS transporter [Rikenellaceae bacterium]MBP3496790.1 MFS transporter [Alistipes sp.]